MAFTPLFHAIKPQCTAYARCRQGPAFKIYLESLPHQHAREVAALPPIYEHDEKENQLINPGSDEDRDPLSGSTAHSTSEFDRIVKSLDLLISLDRNSLHDSFYPFDGPGDEMDLDHHL